MIATDEVSEGSGHAWKQMIVECDLFELWKFRKLARFFEGKDQELVNGEVAEVGEESGEALMKCAVVKIAKAIVKLWTLHAISRYSNIILSKLSLKK